MGRNISGPSMLKHAVPTREQVLFLARLPDPLLAAGVDLHAARLALHRLAALVPLPTHLAEGQVATVPRLPQPALVFPCGGFSYIMLYIEI